LVILANIVNKYRAWVVLCRVARDCRHGAGRARRAALRIHEYAAMHKKFSSNHHKTVTERKFYRVLRIFNALLLRLV
jgi:hypothetical protein